MEEKCILDPQRDCIGKAEAAKLEGRIKALEEWREDSKDFHAKFYDWQRQHHAHPLIVSVLHHFPHFCGSIQ